MISTELQVAIAKFSSFIIFLPLRKDESGVKLVFYGETRLQV